MLGVTLVSADSKEFLVDARNFPDSLIANLASEFSSPRLELDFDSITIQRIVDWGYQKLDSVKTPNNHIHMGRVIITHWRNSPIGNGNSRRQIKNLF